MATYHAMIFPGGTACHQYKLEELGKDKIIGAKHDNGVLMIVTSDGNDYTRYVFRLEGTKYDVRVVKGIQMAPVPNFITMENGVCVSLTEEEELEVFSNKIGAAGVKKIKDQSLSGDMILVHLNEQVGIVRDQSVLSITMR